jgi:penicillin-binding protein 1A
LAKLLITTILGGVFLALLAVAMAGPVHALVTGSASAVAKDETNLAELSQNSTVYAADGSVLAVLHADENRVPVTLDAVPPQLVQAVLDTEDARFWTHGAVDFRSTVRAVSADVRSGGVKEGGSTITQQLVKNAFLTPHRNLDRKVQEAVIAIRLARKLSKRQILERYLNTVYFGNGAYGVQAASETYFGVPVGELTVPQDALLAGIIRDPLDYDPIAHPKAARDRRNAVLDRLVANGHLLPDVAGRIKTEPVPQSTNAPVAPKSSYFVEEVKQRLLGDTSLGVTASERYNALFRGGLKIYTTLDPRLQRLAEDRVRTMIPTTPQGYTGALVTVDSATGKVRAMVGGPGFDKVKFDIATQALRQPGSSFKVFTLLAFLEAGYAPNDYVDGSGPCQVKFPHVLPYHAIGNFEGEAPGVVSVTDATAYSINCAYERLAVTVGLDKVVAMAKRLGIKTVLPAYPSTVIGSAEVHPIDMAGAYATLADDGVYHRPTLVDRVLDRDGKLIEKGGDDGHRVLSPQVSRVAVRTLRAVVQYGTGANAALGSRPVAGKTGTSENYGNAWFDGFTPQLTTVVWMGAPSGNIPIIVKGVRVVGGNYPAKIWGAFMADALAGQPSVDFPQPNLSEVPAYQYIKGTPGNTGYAYSPGGSGSATTTTASPSATTTSSPPVTSAPTTSPPTVPPTTSPPTTSPPTTSPPTTRPH